MRSSSAGPDVPGIEDAAREAEAAPPGSESESESGRRRFEPEPSGAAAAPEPEPVRFVLVLVRKTAGSATERSLVPSRNPNLPTPAELAYFMEAAYPLHHEKGIFR